MLPRAGGTHSLVHLLQSPSADKQAETDEYMRTYALVQMFARTRKCAFRPVCLSTEEEVYARTIATFHFSFRVIHSALVCLKNEMHEFKNTLSACTV